VTRPTTRRIALLGVALIMLVFVTAASAKPRHPIPPTDRGGIAGIGSATPNHIRPTDRGGMHGIGK
jgi:hypothetical protein